MKRTTNASRVHQYKPSPTTIGLGVHVYSPAPSDDDGRACWPHAHAGPCVELLHAPAVGATASLARCVAHLPADGEVCYGTPLIGPFLFFFFLLSLTSSSLQIIHADSALNLPSYELEFATMALLTMIGNRIANVTSKFYEINVSRPSR